ncbi:MAG: YicC/YloC family endoribonuclease [Caulobacterales bacterium]|jgi:uncharacterized protein (TIGR00255 family)
MTGYGRADGVLSAQAWVWEAKSVNGRSLDLKIRLPPGLDRLEPAMREAVRARFKRGSIQLNLRLDRADAAAGAVAINTALVEQLIAAGAPFIAAGKATTPSWDGLLAIRGVVASEAGEEADVSDASQDGALLAGMGEALDRLAAARFSEGAALARMLTGLVSEVERLAGLARTQAGGGPAAIAERIQARLGALGPDLQLDPQRLAQEAALIATKADVREELDRLDAHCAEARTLLAKPEAAGRRLEFLAQEFHREANTLGSKSSDLALTRIALDLKTAIDQLREQSANVE